MASDPTPPPPPAPDAPSNGAPASAPTASAQQPVDDISSGYQPYTPYAPYPPYSPYAPYPVPYAAPVYYPWTYAPPAPGLSGWALTSMICGIISLVFLQPITAILAIIFGYVALNEVKKSGGQVDGHGMALAGVVMGYIALGLSLLFTALYILYFVFIISTLGSFPD